MPQFIRKGAYEAIELEGEWIVFDSEQYTVTKLNEVGGFCWALLGEAQTVDSLQEAVQERYAWVTETVGKDLERFLSELMQCGLVQHAG